MNVWIVQECLDYEGSTFIGVAATAERGKELAQARRYSDDEYVWTWNEKGNTWSAFDDPYNEITVHLEEVVE